MSYTLFKKLYFDACVREAISPPTDVTLADSGGLPNRNAVLGGDVLLLCNDLRVFSRSWLRSNSSVCLCTPNQSLLIEFATYLSNNGVKVDSTRRCEPNSLSVDLEELASLWNHVDAKSFEDARRFFANPPTSKACMHADQFDSVLSIQYAKSRYQILKDSLSEIYRVMRNGGVHRIVADVAFYPNKLGEYLRLIGEAGFHGMRCTATSSAPSLVSGNDVYYRCLIDCFKGKAGPCHFRGDAVTYLGPWSEVKDDDGHSFRRGELVRVCQKTSRLLQNTPYESELFFKTFEDNREPVKDSEECC